MASSRPLWLRTKIVSVQISVKTGSGTFFLIAIIIKMIYDFTTFIKTKVLSTAVFIHVVKS